MTDEAGEQKPRKLRLSKRADNADESSPAEVTPSTPPEAPEPTEPAPKPSLKFKRATPKEEPSPSAPADTAPAEPPAASPPEPATPTEKPALKFKRAAPAQEQAPAQPEPTPEPDPIKQNEIGSASSGLKLSGQDAAPGPETPATPPPLPTRAPSEPTSQAATPPPSPQAVAGPSSGSFDQAIDRIDSGPEKKNPLVGVAIVMVLFLIVGGCGYGIWYVLGNGTDGFFTQKAEEEASTITDEIQLEATSSYADILEEAESVIDQSKESSEALAMAVMVPEESIFEPIAEVAEEAPPTTSAKDQKKISDFLADASYGGVRSGPKARVVINGESYQIGDEIVEIAGLVFVGTKDGQLVFKDENGVVYTKRF
ncbi:MAG: hypothetical protein AAGC73_08340 [Verrucomicrobiota bacterium]